MMKAIIVGNISIGIDWAAMVLLAAIFLIAAFGKKYFASFIPPYLWFSNLKNLKSLSPSPHLKWSFASTRLYQVTLICFALAFVDPHLLVPKNISQSNPFEPPKEGIAIYFDLDQSGSMSQNIKNQKTNSKQDLSKIELLKEVTKKFITDHPSDLIGLIAFARIPHILTPLTLDQEELQNQLDQLHVVQSKEEDGTSIGYAIYKTAHLITATRHFAQTLEKEAKPSYEIKSAVIIVVTDGLQDPNPLDAGNWLRTIELDEAAEYTKSQSIRLYIINIDPSFAATEYAPHRRQLERITHLTGGQFYLINDQEDLAHIYTQINQLEKGEVQGKKAGSVFQRWSLYPFLVALGLLCLFWASFLDLTIGKKIP